jgi:hypothetical protein
MLALLPWPALAERRRAADREAGERHPAAALLP